MFAKKKKSRIQISAPSNFEHRVHTDFDEHEQKFVGLPRQWQSLIEDTAKRPKPFIDATIITTVEPRKVSGLKCCCCLLRLLLPSLVCLPLLFFTHLFRQ